MAKKPDYTTGTVSVAANGLVVTGTGTLWAVADIKPGDTFKVKGLDVIIEEVFSNTSITLVEPWTGGALAASRYAIRYQPDGSRLMAATTGLQEQLDTPNVQSLSALAGNYDLLPIFNGAGSFTTISKSELTTGDTVTKATWPTASGGLQSVVGKRDGQRGIVEADAGTHTDPVVGGTVPNQGVYSYVIASNAWRWLRPRDTDQDVILKDSRTINSGKFFPLKQMNRGGTTSNPNVAINQLLLDAKIYGADPTKFYQFAYYQNGAVIGTPGYGIIIKEFDRATYASTGTETVIHTRTNPAPTIIRGGGVQEISIVPFQRPSMRIDLTVDGDNLLADGTAYNANDLPIRDGWSWIIDPITVRSSASVSSGGSYGPLRVELSADEKSGRFVWSHGSDKMFRLYMRPNGKNGLFNVLSEDIAAIGDPDLALWTNISSTSTDWFPPMIVRSDTSPIDGAATSIYTGGNHGSDSEAGGISTARMIDWSCEIDGRVLTGSFNGTAKCVVFRWTNELFAWNTWSLGRYVIRQHFTASVTQGSVESWCEVEDLENVTVQGENGLQMVPGTYTDYIYYKGQPTARVAAATPATSGTKSAYPNAWATVFSHASNGFRVAWMDRSYEAGDGRYVNAANPYMRHGGVGNAKQYHAVVAGGSGVSLTTRQGYKWHGGYSWAPISGVSGSLDSAFIIKDRQKPFLAYGFLTAGSGQITLPLQYNGLSVGTKAIGGRNRVAATAAGVDYQKEAIT